MYTTKDFEKAFEDYIDYNNKLNNRNIFLAAAEAFGASNGAAKDSGHVQFLEEIQGVIDEICSSSPDTAAADELLGFIFDAKYRYSRRGVSPYIFTAIEGEALGLIKYCSREKLSAIYDDYKKTPYRLRTPVQRKVLDALKNASR